ncbi:MAG: sulfite exporter TauE/SafE family protein, partial [Candidatus Binatus sp.]
AGVLSGLLGIGSGAFKVLAMDQAMRLPFKVSTTTSNFMIGVTAGAGALVFLARGDVATTIAAPVAIGVTAGALTGSRLLPYIKVEYLRTVFVIILVLIAAEMGWRALSGI